MVDEEAGVIQKLRLSDNPINRFGGAIAQEFGEDELMVSTKQMLFCNKGILRISHPAKSCDESITKTMDM